jgi:hypothetical protein
MLIDSYDTSGAYDPYSGNELHGFRLVSDQYDHDDQKFKDRVCVVMVWITSIVEGLKFQPERMGGVCSFSRSGGSMLRDGRISRLEGTDIVYFHETHYSAMSGVSLTFL